MAFMTKRKVFSKHQMALGLMGSTISCQHFFFGRDESVRRWKGEEIIFKKNTSQQSYYALVLGVYVAPVSWPRYIS